MTGSFKSVNGFSGLKKAVKKNNAEREKRQLQARLDEARKVSERDIFLKAVSDVTPLGSSSRVEPHRQKVEPVARQRIADEKKALDESLSDELTLETMLETDHELSYAADGIGPDVVRKLRRGHWVIGAELDLHGMRRDEARDEVVTFLKESNTVGVRCVRIIHGKGLGSVDNEPVLKKLVLRWLMQRTDVLAFCQARPADGGSGALVVLLKGR